MQNDFFDKKQTVESTSKPLPETLRPKRWEDYIGQKELVGTNGTIRNLVSNDNLSSMVLWGPPGVGKTTLARVIANETDSKFIQISAVTSGKKDLQNVIQTAKENSQVYKGKKTILFIDEIHRFNKAQQDYLLPFVEDGTIVLIGATTENPSFEVISPLLSRLRVFVLKEHSADDLEKILESGVKFYKEQRQIDVEFDEGVKKELIAASNGDPRTLLNALEMAVNLSA